jgi:hypothetical protein
MATNIPVVKPQAGDPAVVTPPAGTNGDPTSGTPAAGSPAEPTTYDEAYVKTLRKEAAEYRTKHKSVEDKLKLFEDKDKSELEKAQSLATTEKTRADAAESRARSMQVQLLATKLGVQPNAADKLIDWSKVDDTDEARTAAINALLKDEPWVALTPKVAAPNTPGGNPARPGAKLTMEEIRSMPRDEYMRRKAEVDLVLAGK